MIMRLAPNLESQEGLKRSEIDAVVAVAYVLHARISRRVETIFEGMSGWELPLGVS